MVFIFVIFAHVEDDAKMPMYAFKRGTVKYSKDTKPLDRLRTHTRYTRIKCRETNNNNNIHGTASVKRKETFSSAPLDIQDTITLEMPMTPTQALSS